MYEAQQDDDEFIPQRLRWDLRTPREFFPDVAIAALLFEAINDSLSLTFSASPVTLGFEAVVEGNVNPDHVGAVHAVMRELDRVLEIRRGDLVAARKAGINSLPINGPLFDIPRTGILD